MDKLARDFADEVNFLFVYVREAHPDTHPEWPAHEDIEQKFAYARAMQERHATPRTIVVDDLAGSPPVWRHAEHELDSGPRGYHCV
jgi:hypothetical protein